MKYTLILGIACLMTAGCQNEMLSNEHIASSTAGALGVSPSQVAISDRRSDGATNTFYTATLSSGKRYACTINGGGLLAMGITNPVQCNEAAKL